MQAMQLMKEKNTCIMSYLGVNLEYRLFDNKWRKYTLTQNNKCQQWKIRNVE